MNLGTEQELCLTCRAGWWKTVFNFKIAMMSKIQHSVIEASLNFNEPHQHFVLCFFLMAVIVPGGM